MRTFHKTKLGEIVLGNSLDYLASVQDESVDLIITRLLVPKASIKHALTSYSNASSGLRLGED